MSEVNVGKRGPGAPRKYPYPSTIACTVIEGLTVKTNPKQFAKLIERYGSQAEVIAKFVSRAGKRKLKADAAAAKSASTPATDVPATA
jgi:hypothetical protein